MSIKRTFWSLLLVFLVGTIAFFLISRQDAGPPQDADLRALPPKLQPAENAFTYLENAVNATFWPRTKEKELLSIASDKTWEPEFVEEVLKANAKTFAAADSALDHPALQVPSLDRLANEQELPYLAGWRRIARLYSIRCMALFRAGREKEAYEQALQLLRLGHLMENSGGPILHYMAAAAVKGAAFERIRYLTGRSTLPCADLAALIPELSKYSANQAGISNAIKAEYRLTLKYFDALRAGRAGPTNAGLSQMAFKVGARPLLNVDKTRRLFASSARSYLESIPLPFDEMKVAQTRPRGKRSLLKNILRGNMIGETLLTMTEPAWKGVLVTKCRENVNLRATQTILALKCWHLEHGGLPPTLGDLVPRHLPEIPIDDFDGKPLRYHPAKKLIYSVGKDLIDSGGMRQTPAGESQDLPFEIEF